MRLASILFLVVLILAGVGMAFYIGTRHTPLPPTQTPVTNTPQDDWRTYTDQADGYAVAYPAAFAADTTRMGSTTEWRLNATTTGQRSFLLTIPQSYLPSTNFGDAKFAIGYSREAKAVAACLTPDPSGTPATLSTRSINGASWSVFTFSDAGAGNRYDSTSYRLVRNGACYAMEYTIHYGAIENYPEGSVSAFDEGKVKATLDQIAGTFRFL